MDGWYGWLLWMHGMSDNQKLKVCEAYSYACRLNIYLIQLELHSHLPIEILHKMNNLGAMSNSNTEISCIYGS
jgi:hypothetical protein